MLRSELLRDHLEALRSLSRVNTEPAVAAKLAELADELRIMISVAEVADLAARAPPPLRPIGPTPLRAVPSEAGAVEPVAHRVAYRRRVAGNER
jgi:hypothetical protein